MVFFGTQAPESAFAQSAKDTIQKFAIDRSSRFGMVHAVMSISSQTPGGTTETSLEAWAKGDKLRNDVASNRGKAYAIVNGNEYICKYPGDSVPIIDACSKHTDVWKHLGMIHPGCVGATYRGYDGLRNGKFRWIFDNGLGEVKLEFPEAGRRILGVKELRVPRGVSLLEIRKYGSNKEYLQENPEADFVALRHEFELVFSKSVNGELVKYRKVQEKAGGGSRTELLLRNQHDFDEASGYWYVSQCDWEHYANGELFSKTRVMVNSIDFSEFDDVVFSIEGLDLTDGSVIHDRSDNGRTKAATIRDGRLSFAGTMDESRVEKPLPTVSNRGTRAFFIANFVVSSLLLATWWSRKRRRIK